MTEVSLNVPWREARQQQQQPASQPTILQQQFQRQQQLDLPSPNIGVVCRGEVFIPYGTTREELEGFLKRQP